MPVMVEDQYALLPAQAGLVYNTLRAPGVDVVQVVVGCGAAVDRDAWAQAWRQVVGRHAVLRTSFRFLASGEPLQEVHRDADIPIEWQTIAGDPRAELAAFLTADRAQAFDMATNLRRVTMLEHPTAGCTMVFTFHHAILDGRSLQIVLTELFTEYAAICRGENVEFAAPRPYRDFVAWWQKVDLAPAQAFWSEFLRGYAPAQSLPGLLYREAPADGTSASPDAGQTDRVADPMSHEVALPESIGAALREAASRAHVTFATLVNAAWAVLLSRYLRTDDVLFAITRSCRYGAVEGAESMVGLLINTVPLRVRVPADATIGDLLRDVQQRVHQVRDHQLAPLGDIQRWGGLAGAGPDTLVIFERRQLRTALTTVDAAFAEREVVVRRQPSFPLTLYVFDEPAPRVSLTYDRGRYLDASAKRVLHHMVRVLTTFAGDHSVRLCDIDLLDDEERQLVVHTWNATSSPYPRDATIPSIFADQVAASPRAPAVVFGSAEITYAELDERANQLAHLLQEYGVGLEEPVGVALPRSIDLIVALLAVLKAGGAYVALDPANPPARTALVLADCQAKLVITDRTLEKTLPPEVIALRVDRVASDLARRPVIPPPCPARATSLAYLCYTSGSTGVPKGTGVPHRAVLRLVHQPNFATLGPGETLLVLSAIAFDVSTLEIWGALLTGARLVVAPPGPLSVPEIAAVLRDSGVSMLWLTAGLFHQIVELDVTALANVRQLIAGGDVLAPEAVRAALRARGGLPMVNGYGPTENTTFTSCHRIADPAEVGDRVPIGRPIQQSTVYVLDEQLRPVPIGVPGELCTGGDGVARGYLGQPGLTATKFVPDPFSPQPGARLYRTGDLARWRADGVLEFLGRLDGQVKIRGFRVEPGEVEAVLRGHRDVTAAVVVPRGEGETKHLVAYVTISGGQRAAVAQAVREHAMRHLPEYLVPTAVVVLDRLPLNVSGKVDRKELPDPATQSPTVDNNTPVDEPGSPVEVTLAQIWREILHISQIGRNDDFFALGGNSLAATRLIFRIREAFGVDVPILALYQAATLAGCAQTIEARLPEPYRPASPASAAPVGAGAITRRDRSAYRVSAKPTQAVPQPSAPAAAESAPAVPTAGKSVVVATATTDPMVSVPTPAAPGLVPPTAQAATSTGSASTAAPAATPSKGTIIRRDRSAYRVTPGDRSVADASTSAPQPDRDHAASTSSATAQRDTDTGAASAVRVPDGGASGSNVPGWPAHLWPLDSDKWGIWRWICFRSAGFPFELHDALASPELVAAADRLVAAGYLGADAAKGAGVAKPEDRDRAALRDAYHAEFARAERVLSRALHAVAADPRFRSAVAWQNRHALATGVDALLRRDPDTVARTGRYRKYEALVASYLQRYCAKNDTIGFFGPVGWVDIRADARAVELDPAPGGTLAARTVYFETWAIQALAEAYEQGLGPWLVPRRLPFVDVVGPPEEAYLQRPYAPPVPLSAIEARVFGLIDGMRTATEVANCALADGWVTEPDQVMQALTSLVAQHAIAWRFDIAPNDVRAEESMRQRLAQVTDPALREPALAALNELVTARDAVIAANTADDVPALVDALESLETTFTRLTGTAATRRPGQTYAGRTLLFEECLRPRNLCFGPQVLESLAEPLELVLYAARWFTAAGAALFHRGCLDVYRKRVAKTGERRVPFTEFWLEVNDLIFDATGLSVGAITRVLQQRWSSVLHLPEGVRQVQLRSADLRDQVHAAFATSQAGWTTAVQHSPDLMIAASSVEAIRSGDFWWVLGELHPGTNTLRYATWLAYHQEQDKMRQAMLHDLGRPVTYLGPTGAAGGTPARLSNVLVGPQDTYLIFAPDSNGYDPKRALFIGEFDIEEIDGRLKVQSRRGGPPRDLVELLADPLGINLSQFFRIVPSARYTPRVAIDRLVVQRESWKFSAGELAFAHIVDESRRFLHARRWTIEYDLPRYVFARAQGEPKPFFVDMASLASIDLLSRAIRRAQRHAGDGATIGITEMLPGPDQLWLVDAEGRRYTSELRICAVERRRA